VNGVKAKSVKVEPGDIEQDMGNTKNWEERIHPKGNHGSNFGKMKVGGAHLWKYQSEVWSEKKIAPRKWSFTFEQTKTRLGRTAPTGSGFPVGGRLLWGITATQRAVKTGPNTYKLIMSGTKKQLGYKTGSERDWR
jgi:hypothetical protein